MVQTAPSHFPRFRSLAISAVEAHAQASTTPISVGFLYIRYSDKTGATARDLLEVLVKQTIERHPAALSLFNEVYARHIHEKTQPSEKEILGLLKRFTSEVTTTTFYFLDALDEAPAEVQAELLESLMSLNIKLFITSRPLKLLEARFPDAHHFPIIAQDSDLEVHISKEMSRSMELQAILAIATPGLEGRITMTIKRKCSGMFLHASLQLQALRECTSRSDVEKTLHDFPPQIKDVYLQTWTRIVSQPSGKASLAASVLAWVLYATRSLTVEELRHAVASSLDTYSFEKTRLVSAEVMVGVCCGLLAIEKETGLVRLVHYSAQAVLQTLILESIPNPHSQLAAICMACLRDCGLQRSSLASADDLDAALTSTPLLEYAYHSWSVHGRESMHDPAAKSRLSNFIKECHAFPILPGPRATFDRFSPLHVAAYFDLPPSLAGPDQLRNPNHASEEQGLTPLHLACMQNSRLAVEELLSLPRILINAPDKEGVTALIWASMSRGNGDPGIVDLLLSRPNIKVNQTNKAGAAALHLAGSLGRSSIVQRLLAHPKIKVNLADVNGVTPFMAACTWTDVETVKLFLADRKLNVNSADKLGSTALIWMMVTVAPVVHIDMVKAILAHPKLDVNHWDKAGKPTAYWVKRTRRQEVIDLFLAHPKVRIRR
ncbi:ankyrin repeat-containing domain protein [Coprinopsis sp. MPI-PUGE-AT-0042]|nr:ankyrin repeat-containing domain protein [Coprinopsis sp. MPI-PUGE-AT-0042]